MRNIEEIFADILSHQIKGLMIHGQLADYYYFLGLPKYAETHEHQYKDESCCWREMAKYYIKHFNKLPEEKRIDNPDIIPQDWYKAIRQDVDTSTKRRAVENGLKIWVDWESETKKLYEEAFAEMIALTEIAAAMRLKKCIKDVDDELSKAQGYWLHKKAIDYDIDVIVGEQYEC